ncbi:peptidase C14, caspase domain-containing protein, partial [Armillaria nabsnona]
ASRLWAVLIGIDKYSSSDCSILRGCINDVKKMAEFLINDLGMSEGRIHCLLNVTSPTRENIVDKLFNLSTNPEIQHGDSIIIYFSGHGSAYICSDYYEARTISAEGSIEALCPMDRTASDADISIPDISDREINTILTEISLTKGPHITVILDC